MDKPCCCVSYKLRCGPVGPCLPELVYSGECCQIPCCFNFCYVDQSCCSCCPDQSSYPNQSYCPDQSCGANQSCCSSDQSFSSCSHNSC